MGKNKPDNSVMPENTVQEFLDIIKLPNPDAKWLNYLIVMPRIATRNDRAYLLPYGLCLVSSALKASGRSVFTLNLNYKENPYELLKQTITGNSIDVVLTGGLSGQYPLIKAIVDTAKAANPSVVTCVGGGMITADPIVAMEALETADYGIVGEGEITVNEFAYALENELDLEQVDGIVHFADGRYSITRLRPEISDLDILPFADYDGFEFHMSLRSGVSVSRASDNLENVAFIAVGRSCPYNCTFCFHSSGKKYRKRTIESICREIDWIVSKYKIGCFDILDEMFVYDKDFTKEFTEQMKIRNLDYLARIRVDSASRETLQMFKDSGCRFLCFGIESADNHILKSMRKGITVEQIDQALDWAFEVGLPASGNIILGDLEETPETMVKSLNWWKKRYQKNCNINLKWILTFPGTHLYKVACDRGIITDRVEYLKDCATQINVTKMPDEQYWEAVNKVSVFRVLATAGIDIDFNETGDAAAAIGKNLDSLAKEYRIAVWPTTYVVIEMLEYISPEFVSSSNVFFVNINPSEVIAEKSRIGGSSTDNFERSGKKIHKPDEIIVGDKIDLVLYAHDYVYSGKLYRQIEETIKNRHPGVKRIVKISELIGNKYEPK